METTFKRRYVSTGFNLLELLLFKKPTNSSLLSHLTRTAPPQVTRVYDPNAVSSDNITIQEHSSLTLQCNTTNDIPKATIRWLKLIPPIYTTLTPSTTPPFSNMTTTTTASSTATNNTNPSTTSITTTTYIMTKADWENETIDRNKIQVR